MTSPPERAVHAQGSLVDLLAEVDPAGEWCLRWANGHHSWRHRRDGGFDARRYFVEPIAEATAKSYVLQHHYAHSYPAAVRRFGLFVEDDNEDPLVGVAVFSVPVATAVLTRVFPEAEPITETLELGRFVLEGDVQAHEASSAGRAPANAESWFLARCFGELAAAGIRGIVSFSDPVPRRIDRPSGRERPPRTGEAEGPCTGARPRSDRAPAHRSRGACTASGRTTGGVARLRARGSRSPIGPSPRCPPLCVRPRHEAPARGGPSRSPDRAVPEATGRPASLSASRLPSHRRVVV